MTVGVRARSFDQEPKRYPDGTVTAGGLNLNVPDGKLTGPLVTRRGRTGTPKEKEDRS